MRRCPLLTQAFAIVLTASFASAAGAASFDAGSLDAALAAHQWARLGPALSNPQAGRDEIAARDVWMADHVRQNPNFFLAMILSRDEWGIAAVAQDQERAADLRLSSGTHALLAFALVGIDGRQCADETAPQHRAEQILQQRSASLSFLRSADTAIQMQAIRNVVTNEARTAASRDEESLVCSGGLSQIQAGLAAGSQVNMPNDPNHYGRTVGVIPPTGWQPSYVAESAYAPLQQRDRQRLSASLGAFLHAR